VALSGAATATTTADASGNYSFAGLAAGSYTLTPSKSGYTFTPASQPVTITNCCFCEFYGSGVLNDFAAWNRCHNIGGHAECKQVHRLRSVFYQCCKRIVAGVCSNRLSVRCKYNRIERYGRRVKLGVSRSNERPKRRFGNLASFCASAPQQHHGYGQPFAKRSFVPHCDIIHRG
jgi:hypothetical protein